MGQDMARITVEDCMEHVPNRFHLVRMASIRAKQLKKGALPLLPSEKNKHVVMALREIAAGLVKPGEAESSSNLADSADNATEATEATVTTKGATAQATPGEEIAPTVESDEPTPDVES
jgi:DNA-directed RNA polymerase subunit omega